MHGRSTARLGAAALVVAALAVAPAGARAAGYTVTGTGDPGDGACSDFTCQSLRAAVDASNLTPEPDSIALGQTTYTLSQGASLNLAGNLTISGLSPRKTVIQGNSAVRVLNVA